MKKYIKSILAMLLALASQQLLAANTVTTVNQVTEAVTVSTDVDYTITSTTPFATTGSVNITNTDHAVVIIRSIKPSVVIKNWLKNFVFINGQQAVEGSNCQVKMYGYGAIIFPYAKDIKPLTVYSEKDFGGTAVNNFGLEHTGGFMNTLTTEKLNNQIRSFKLKRGYMVTFSTRPGGRGYSRCFIADKADLEISSLPLLMDQKISSYRVFHWFNAKKAGIADMVSATASTPINASWTYGWGPGSSLLPDVECVPQHIHEGWPSAAELGNATYSCHMKTNNEPGNSADPNPNTVAEVLANWESLMRTGQRLLSNSSHDGSMNHLKAVMDSIDARGWRCDVLDLHCYWASGSFNNLTSYSDNYGKGRPIWISEWVWGASWNHNGFWAAVSDPGSLSAENQQKLYDGTVPILRLLNSNTRVERYAYWNGEAAGTRIYDGGKLTKLGEYYANMGEGLGYNPANEYIPTLPPMKNTGTLSVDYDKETKKAVLKWRDYNGEYNSSMVLQQQALGGSSWTDLKTIDVKEQEALYTETVENCNDGTKFRVVIKVPTSNIDSKTKTLTGNTVTARSATLSFGDPISVMIDGQVSTKYLGGNKLVNGDFSFGTMTWKAGDGNTIAAPYFQVMPEGGVSNSPYLQTYGSSSLANAQTIIHAIAIEKGTSYYVAGSGLNASTSQKFRTTTTGQATYKDHMSFSASSSWVNQSSAFYNADDDNLNVRLVSCAGKAQFDDLMVCQLFDTPEEALADALAWEKKRAEMFAEYNTMLPALNAKVAEVAAAATTVDAIEESIQKALDIINTYKQKGNSIEDANTIISMHLSGYEDVAASLEKYNMAVSKENALSMEEMQKAISGLKDDVENALPYAENTTTIQNGSFASATGWTTKAGTYTAGDQRTNTFAGKPCWNAWWSVATAANPQSQTMAIKQTISNLDEGFYALECKGSTQHLCETDQHAFLTYNGKDYNSPVLDFGNADIPSFPQTQMWRTMTTPYVYVKAGASATVGFMGSKKGAVDNSWLSYGTTSTTAKGDNREGWWCATDFKLRFIPALSKKPESNWGIVCMPYKIELQEGVQLYSIAGISTDSLHIYIKPVEEPQAGYPYVYYSTKSDVLFTGSGTKVTSAKTSFGLKGTLANSTVKYSSKSLTLVDGKWIYNPGTTKVVPSNSGYVQFVSNITNKYDVAPEGTIAMPIEGFIKWQVGDVNHDGAIDLVDAKLITEYFTGIKSETYFDPAKADYNGDGIITIDDANCIVNTVVK